MNTENKDFFSSFSSALPLSLHDVTLSSGLMHAMEMGLVEEGIEIEGGATPAFGLGLCVGTGKPVVRGCGISSYCVVCGVAACAYRMGSPWPSSGLCDSHCEKMRERSTASPGPWLDRIVYCCQLK